MLYGIESLECYLHQYVRAKKKAGRPRMDYRKAMSARFYILRTGCQWNVLPRSLGVSGDRYMTDSRNGERLVFSSECGWMDWPLTDKKAGIDWKWQAMDGVITKAPLGGKKHRTKSYRQS